jgi:hypothetical protein
MSWPHSGGANDARSVPFSSSETQTTRNCSSSSTHDNYRMFSNTARVTDSRASPESAAARRTDCTTPVMFGGIQPRLTGAVAGQIRLAPSHSHPKGLGEGCISGVKKTNSGALGRHGRLLIVHRQKRDLRTPTGGKNALRLHPTGVAIHMKRARADARGNKSGGAPGSTSKEPWVTFWSSRFHGVGATRCALSYAVCAGYKQQCVRL